MKVRWSHEPEPHDYPAATAYLSLITDPVTAETLAVKWVTGS
ncbi:hypothetical protein ABIB56_003311 [Glaciihabitans sp. UYNi722]